MFSRKQEDSSDTRGMPHGSPIASGSQTANGIIRPAYVIERYAAYYPMNHKRRGMALIFSHNKYNVRNVSLPVREGSAIDCKRLKETLELFRFDVKVYPDFKLEEIKSVIGKGKVPAARLERRDSIWLTKWYLHLLFCSIIHGSQRQ